MRINELARELEVKAKAIIDYLPTIGVHDKRSHSSSIEGELAEQVRRHFAGEAGERERESGGVAVAEQEAPATAPSAESVAPAAEAGPETREAVAEPAEEPAAAPAPAASATPAPRPAVAGTRTVLRPPIRPHVTPPPPPAPAPAASAAPPAQQAPPPQAAPAMSAPPAAEEQPAAKPAPPQTSTMPAYPTLSPAPPAPQGLPPRPGAPRVMPPPQPHQPRIGVQGRMGAPRPGVPGPVNRPGGMPAQPRVSQGPNVTAPPVRPPQPPPQPRTVTPGQPIYQPRPGMGGRPQRPGAQAGAAPGTRPQRPPMGRPGGYPGSAPPPGAGRFERRPQHPTRARPGGPGAAVAPPPGTVTDRPRPPQRPSAPVRDRERPLRQGPPSSSHAAFVPRNIDREITITEGITIKDLAEKLGAAVKAKDLMQRLISRGKLVTINQALDLQVAKDLARDFGATAQVLSFEEAAEQEAVMEVSVEDRGELVPRPPVVTIMGHVDHGKTSLLDAIRLTHVTEQEFGGITQHIGAYQVETRGRKVTFIDTPGHEAFTRMRARGSKVTDIVVLVVAADDGVMPQTLEAIDHARAANVPIIVAVNKIDKADAQPERVKRQLADRGLMPEDWGGQTVMVEVSALQKKNLDLLLEMILLLADMQELKANPTRPATGTVLEAKLDKGRGPVATVLVQNGTLRPGDPFIVGPVFAKVRALMDDKGRPIEEAPPATPVEVLGLGSLPVAGDQFQVVTDILKAKQMAMYREQKAREVALSRSARVTLDQLHEQMKAGAVKDLNIILKADVHGSAEVVAETLTKLATEKVKVKIVHTGVGAITESDVLLASASNAIIIGFNVRPERKAQETAEQEKVDIRLHTIIYEVVDEMKKAMTGLLEPTTREVQTGRAEVRDTFRIPKVGAIAGCYVQDGRIPRGAHVRLLRDNVVIYTGRVSSLRRFKEDVSEVRSGFECGIGLENYSDIKQGDIIEAFAIEKVAAELPA